MNVDLAGQLVGGTVAGVTGDASVCSILSYMAHEIGIGMSTKNQIWGSIPILLHGKAFLP